MSLKINLSAEIRKGFKYKLFSDSGFHVTGFRFSENQPAIKIQK